MTPGIMKALKRLETEVEGGEQPDRLMVEDREYGLYYGDNEYGCFVEVSFGWPTGWYGVLEGDTWGGQEAVRYYYEVW